MLRNGGQRFIPRSKKCVALSRTICYYLASTSESLGGPSGFEQAGFEAHQLNVVFSFCRSSPSCHPTTPIAIAANSC